MTSLPSSTRSRRQCKNDWLSFYLLMSPFIALTSTSLSGVLLFHSLRIHSSITPTPTSPNLESTTPTPTDLHLQHPPAPLEPVLQSDRPGIKLTTTEFYQLITLSILEAPTLKGRLDVIQSVFNRLNTPQVDLGNYGTNITEVVFAEGQYEPYFHLSPNAIVDFDSAVTLLARHGYTHRQAKTALAEVTTALQDPQQVTNARNHVGGRTAFKGISQYPHRVPSEDPLRAKGENFFHIDANQTYEQLTELAKLGPETVELAESTSSCLMPDHIRISPARFLHRGRIKETCEFYTRTGA
ncbi:MAG: hypothetical protein AAGC93_24270 [Cyanobacteria bacterium P01_F01_bin.53]